MEIFWIKINKLEYSLFIPEIIKLKKQVSVFTPNPEILLKTLEDKDFKKLLLQASYLTPDGIGLYLAAQLLENTNILVRCIKLPYYVFNLLFRKSYLYKKYWERICGSDLTNDILAIAEAKKIKIAIIDLYNPGDAKKVASQEVFIKKLKATYPNLQADYFIYHPEHKEEIIQKIFLSKSKILFSTLGMKSQEESVIDILSKCKNIKLWLWVWSSFDYINWYQKRAPLLFRKIGLEWLYRVFTSPNKVARLQRIYTAIFVFTYKVIIYKNK